MLPAPKRLTKPQLLNLCKGLKAAGRLPNWPEPLTVSKSPLGQSEAHKSVKAASHSHSSDAIPDGVSLPKSSENDGVGGLSSDTVKENATQSTAEVVDTLHVAEMVLEAARVLAEGAGTPGVSQAAFLVSFVVKLAIDHRGAPQMMEKRVRMCQSVLFLLERAEAVLGQV